MSICLALKQMKIEISFHDEMPAVSLISFFFLETQIRLIRSETSSCDKKLDFCQYFSRWVFLTVNTFYWNNFSFASWIIRRESHSCSIDVLLTCWLLCWIVKPTTSMTIDNFQERSKLDSLNFSHHWTAKHYKLTFND